MRETGLLPAVRAQRIALMEETELFEQLSHRSLSLFSSLFFSLTAFIMAAAVIRAVLVVAIMASAVASDRESWDYWS